VDFKQWAIYTTTNACNEFVRHIRAMPADKLEWRPNDDCRTALDMFQEVAQSPTWGVMVLKARDFPSGDGDDMKQRMIQAMEQRRVWDTVEKCEEAMNANLEALFATIREFPEEELMKKIHLPFGGGMERTLADMCLVQYWNATYHLGQVCYIQRMYGDTQMH
jgi:hypothetical protein